MVYKLHCNEYIDVNTRTFTEFISCFARIVYVVCASEGNTVFLKINLCQYYISSNISRSPNFPTRNSESLSMTKLINLLGTEDCKKDTI
jgi:hypothetical protein